MKNIFNKAFTVQSMTTLVIVIVGVIIATALINKNEMIGDIISED